MNRRIVRSVVRIVALALGCTDWQAQRAAYIAGQCLEATSDPMRAIRVGVNAARTLRGARRPSTAIELPAFTAYGERVAAMRIVAGSTAVQTRRIGAPDEE